MVSLILVPVVVFALAFCLGIFLFPMLVNMDKQIVLANDQLTDGKGNVPTPYLGGIGIAIVLLTTFSINPFIQEFAFRYPTVCLIAALVSFTGLVSDKKNTSVAFRFITELCCAALVVYSGQRIVSLPFIGTLPLLLQYGISISLIYFITNVYKLSAKKESWTGIMPVINLASMAAICFFLNQPEWAAVLAAAAGAVIAYLQFNRQSDKILLGNGGGMLIGYIIGVTGVHLLDASKAEEIRTVSVAHQLPLVLIACFAIPMVYAIKVFTDGAQRQKTLSGIE